MGFPKMYSLYGLLWIIKTHFDTIQCISNFTIFPINYPIQTILKSIKRSFFLAMLICNQHCSNSVSQNSVSCISEWSCHSPLLNQQFLMKLINAKLHKCCETPSERVNPSLGLRVLKATQATENSHDSVFLIRLMENDAQY